MRIGSARATGLCVLALLISAPAVSSGNDRLVFVPWKVLEPDQAGPLVSLTLFWIPASPDELRKSELVTSRTLALFAGRCVGMQVIRPDDGARMEKFGVAEPLPVALLMEGDRELARVAGDGGLLRAPDVETMVRQAVDQRELACDALLDSARDKIAAGESEAAIDIYKHVWEQRCSFPRQAREAQRALKRLRPAR